MNSDDLTEKQAEQIKETVRRFLHYLSRLTARMDRQRFPHDDELRTKTKDAYDKVHSLHVTLHYLSCGRGKVWQKRKP